MVQAVRGDTKMSNEPGNVKNFLRNVNHINWQRTKLRDAESAALNPKAKAVPMRLIQTWE